MSTKGQFWTAVGALAAVAGAYLTYLNLNPESKRKTAVAVSLRDGERTFGSDALSAGVRFPKTCYFYLLDLLAFLGEWFPASDAGPAAAISGPHGTRAPRSSARGLRAESGGVRLARTCWVQATPD